MAEPIVNQQQQFDSQVLPDQRNAPLVMEAEGSENRGLELGKSLRGGFIRKVYLILAAQLLLTLGMTLLAYFVPGYVQFQQRNIWLLIVAMVLNIGLLYTLVCFKSVARSVPINYILLGLFTATEAFLV